MSNVAIVGAGLIGRAWANVFARAGWRVRLYDPDPAVRADAPGLVRESLHDLARHGLVEAPGEAAERIEAVETLEAAVAEADFIQENGPESLAAKTAIFRALDAAAPPEAILASSSSAIVSSLFTEGLEGRARGLNAHPVNPPNVVPIVELCGAPWTAPETIARARAVYEAVGQVPIVVKKEVEGFIVNRLQAVLLSEAMRMVSQGYCSAEDLDKTIAHGLGLRWSFMGPFETIELNAPGGIADYCGRFGETMLALASSQVTPELWSKETVAAVVEDWGRSPGPEEIARKSRWRDGRLAALSAHKRSAPDYP